MKRRLLHKGLYRDCIGENYKKLEDGLELLQMGYH